jgi:hypothetical protein
METGRRDGAILPPGRALEEGECQILRKSYVEKSTNFSK